MKFEFSTVPKIIFGQGIFNSIGDLAKDFGIQILVVSGAPADLTSKLLNLLSLDEKKNPIIKIHSEPTVDGVRDSLELARQISPDVIIGLGGGSTIDTAKVFSALLTNPGDITDYLEVVGKNKPLTHPSRPLIAIPTTAGTGSEVTRNAVISSAEYKIKVSLRSDFLFPRTALIDPELTISLPPQITAFTGLDALTQLIEAFTSNNSNPITDSLCKEGISRISRSFYNVYNSGSEIESREDMAIGALFSGISLANAKLGAVHGLAGPIGGEISAHHGAICASLLANVMEANISALSSLSQYHSILDRYSLIGQLLNGNHSASAQEGVEWVRTFCLYAGIQSLSGLGLTETKFPVIIEKAIKSSSMKGNPITLSESELRSILQRSF